MCAELLGVLGEMAEVFAAEVDRRIVAGLTCETAYVNVQRR